MERSHLLDYWDRLARMTVFCSSPCVCSLEAPISTVIRWVRGCPSIAWSAGPLSDG